MPCRVIIFHAALDFVRFTIDAALEHAMTTELREAIARLRGAHKADYSSMLICDADDIELVCDALEAHLKPAPRFDKVAYQREYMRKRRRRAKLIRDSSRWLPPA